jgi:hypothetical protein
MINALANNTTIHVQIELRLPEFETVLDPSIKAILTAYVMVHHRNYY